MRTKNKNQRHFYLKRPVVYKDRSGRDVLSLHRFGILLVKKSENENQVEISGALCSPVDNFSRKIALDKVIERVNSHSDRHKIIMAKDAALKTSIQTLIETLNLNARDSYLDKISIMRYTRVFKSLVKSLFLEENQISP